MTYIYILGYIIMGLGVAKYFQRWMNKVLEPPKVDMGLFFVLLLLWPLCVIIKSIAWLTQLCVWFFHLWEAKP